MENFMKILTMPDNIPVVGMVIALVLIIWVWYKQVVVIDTLLKNDEKDKIYKEMTR